ncbi:MAG: UDP-N-acetylmuramyl-tripeptide synthetase [bacterium]|nr:UDP-N-acetylmuramyl-tripeptide synthetase [bacterium]
MIYFLKKCARAVLPKIFFQWYHRILTGIVAWRYQYPSRKLVVIGVTGTNGKSTTSILIADLLKASGKKVGLASSVLFRVGNREWNNDLKMTMLGRGALQSLLAQMVSEGCTHVVIETSSEGLAQGRLAGLDVDVAVYTNLTPEHIESHGSFEKYQKAKGRLFASLAGSYKKILGDKKIPKIIVANTDDDLAHYFLQFSADKKIGFGMQPHPKELFHQWYSISGVKIIPNHVDFVLNHIRIQTCLEGLFNVYNTACAYVTVDALGIEIEPLKDTLLHTRNIPGRMEWIDEGQDYRVLVDYAPEPASLKALYTYIRKVYMVDGIRIIHVLGSTGGGRDTSRRPILGAMAGKNADIVIVTNEDPYDEDPDLIIEQVANGAIDAGKVKDMDLFMIQDRKKAIIKACNMATAGDIVILTGKGAEHMIMGSSGTTLPWNEGEIAREAIRLSAKSTK